MLGFREKLFVESREILESFYYQEPVSVAQARTLRECWECSKSGNLLLDAIDDLAAEGIFLDGRNALWDLVNLPGFLTSRENWHTKRAAKRYTRVYRGCGKGEYESGEFGFSWSLSLDVARFFAERRTDDAVLMEADAKISGWLGDGDRSAEHECLVLFNEDLTNISCEDVRGNIGNVNINWDAMQKINLFPNYKG